MRSLLLFVSLSFLCLSLASMSWGVAGVSLTLTPSDNYFWGETAPNITATLTLQDGQASANVRLLDYHKAPLQELWSGTLTGTKTVALTLPRYGVYFVEASVQLPGGAQTVRRSFSWLRATAPIWDDSPFGVGTHFMQGGDDQVEKLHIIKNMGATWMRDDYLWNRAEASKGVISKPDAYEKYIYTARSLGLHLNLLLLYGNGIYENGKSPVTPEGLAAYANYCAQVTRNYDGVLSTWEIWNEPNLTYMVEGNPGAKPYINAFKQAASVIRTVDPTLQISGGSIAGNDFPYIEEILRAGCGQQMDLLSIHPYYYPMSPDAAGAVENLRKLQQMLHQYGADKVKVWITEFGYPTHIGVSGVSEATSAAYLVRQFVTSLSIPIVQRMFVYDFQDDGTDPMYNECNFGLIHNDKTPKVAYAAYNTMVRMLAHRTFTRTYPTIGNNVNCFQYVGADGPVQVLWATRGTAAVTITGKRHGRVTLTDLMGNTMPLPATRGGVSLVLTEEPCFISNMDAIRAAKSAVSLTGMTSGWPGETSEIGMKMRDTSLAKRAWTLQAPEGWTVRAIARNQFAVTPSPLAVLGTHVLHARSGDLDMQLPWVLRDPVTRVSQRDDPSCVHVTIDNPYNEARTVIVTPKSDALAIPAQRVTLPAHATQTLSFDINTETPSGWTYFPVAFTASWQHSAETATVTSPITYEIIRGITPCHHMTTVSLDGTLDEWQAQKPCVATAPQANDLTAKIWTGYDDQAWYLAMRVEDDAYANPLQPSNMWGFDSVQFALAVGNARYEYGVARNDAGETLRYQWAPLTQIPEELQVATHREGTTTCYEIRVPLSSLGIKSFTTTPAYLAVLFNDNDGKERKMVEWFPGIGKSKDPERYSPLVPVK